MHRHSEVVLTLEEHEAQMRAEGKTEEHIAAELDHRQRSAVAAQARFDKAPPKYFKPVPKK